MAQAYDIWVDVSNTPQVHVIRALLKDLREYSVYITAFKRGEVVELMQEFGLHGRVFGGDRYNPFLKGIAFATRSFKLLFRAPRAKILLSAGNVSGLPGAIIRRMKRVVLTDNEIKLSARGIFQRVENSFLKNFDLVIVPRVSESEFKKFLGDNVVSYDGYKEHIYIADYLPDQKFTEKLPFQEYIVLRPESLTSHYVLEKESLVPRLLDLFIKEGINVIYLPRNAEERNLARKYLDSTQLYIPPKAMNGLDLIYYSNATLTGSGTMAREAAVLGVPAVSFFPRKRLLAVDRDLVEKGKMLHSRDPKEILEYVLENWQKRGEPEIEKVRNVKASVVKLIREVIENGRKD